MALKALMMARTDAGLTISELAKRAGVSRDTISNAERGRHSLRAPTLAKLAEVLSKAPSELLAEEERLAPKVQAALPLEDRGAGHNDVIAEERRCSFLAETLAAGVEVWTRAIADSQIDRRAAFGIARAVEVLEDALSAVTGAEERWARLSEEERRDVTRVMSALHKVDETYRTRAEVEGQLVEINARFREIEREAKLQERLAELFERA